MASEPQFPGWEHRKMLCENEHEEDETLSTMGERGRELAALREGESGRVTLYFRRRYVP